MQKTNEAPAGATAIAGAGCTPHPLPAPATAGDHDARWHYLTGADGDAQAGPGWMVGLA